MGWDIYDDAITAVKRIFSKANNLVWNNFNTFKMYYYQNLFAVMYNLKLRFFIKNMDEVEDLENNIGDLIEEKRKESAAEPGKINLNLLEKLDQDIYNRFLDIKTKYNRFSPVSKDVQVLAMIKRDIKNFLKKFEESNATNLTPKFQQIIGEINGLTKSWVIETANKPEISVQVNNLREGMPMVYPVIQHVMDSSMPDTKQMSTDVPHDQGSKLQMDSIHQMEESIQHHHDDDHSHEIHAEGHSEHSDHSGFIHSDKDILDEGKKEIENGMDSEFSDNESEHSQDGLNDMHNKIPMNQPDDNVSETDPELDFS